MTNQQSDSEIRTRPCPNCYLCGTKGEYLYHNLSDRLFGAPGKWDLKKCPNSECGLVWLDPIPMEDDLGKAYINYYTHESVLNSFAYRLRQRVKRGYAGLGYGYFASIPLLDCILAIPILFLPFARQQIIASGLMYLRGENTGRLLEIGCGSGFLLAGMRDLGWETEGIDIDPYAVKIARDKLHLKVHLGMLESQNFQNNIFDAIVMSHVIEHVYDPLAIFTESLRILRPGGKLVVTTPNIESLGHRRFQTSWLHLDPPRHLFIFSLRTMKKIAEKSGLSVAVLRSTTRWADGLWVASENIRRNNTGKMGGKMNLGMRLRSKLFQITEALSLIKSKTIGEEIVLIAEKR